MPKWAGPMLRAAGIYNMLWGAWIVLFPLTFFEWTSLPLPNYPMIWQSVGMIVGVYGVGYFIASYNPVRHWPIILVGFMGKIFGPIGALYYGIVGTYPWIFGLHNITNDIIWIVPFGIVLGRVWHQTMHTAQGVEGFATRREALESILLPDGTSLYEQSKKQPVFLLFVRHLGCTFCREALAQLAEKRQQYESQGILPVVVHMSAESSAASYAKQHGLENVEMISDPTCRLYRAFSVERGSTATMFGLTEWLRGFYAGILKGHGVGLPEGDAFRLSGAFLVQNGSITASWLASRASTPVPFDALACALPNATQESANPILNPQTL